eukprot:8508729-Alexandrium_andersonii.AAC.1
MKSAGGSFGWVSPGRPGSILSRMAPGGHSGIGVSSTKAGEGPRGLRGGGAPALGRTAAGTSTEA